MTLQEKIKKIKIDEGEYIHIGSGSGYFFVGTKEEYEGWFDRISEEYRKRIEDKMIASAIALNKRKPFNPKIDVLSPTSTDEIGDYIKALLNFNRELKDKISKEIADVKHNYQTYHSSKKELESWTDFKDREVKDVFDRISGDGVAVIIDGCENGNYWDRKEFCTREGK